MNKQGYMMIELIVILMVISSFIYFIPMFNRSSDHQKVENFVELLEGDVAYSKLHSSTHIDIVKIRFYPDRSYYTIQDSSNRISKKVLYDPAIIIKPYISSNTIQISFGQFAYSGYFIITCGSVQVKLSIYLLHGEFYVSEQ